MTEFEHIDFLWGLLTIILFALLFWLMRRWQYNALKKFGDYAVISRLITDHSVARPLVKFILMTLAFASLIFAIANLKIGSKLGTTKRKGIDIIIALDISNSMLAQDIKPSRIERSRMAIQKLIEKFEDDQIGIIVFAGKAQVLLPITTDYAAAKLVASSADPSIIQAQGTAIGEAISLASASFDSKSKNKKAIIVISDGENHEDDAIEAAQEAAKKGILIYTIGMGSSSGAPIPIGMKGFNIEYKKDSEGNTVVTKLNEAMLQQIATIGNGMYVRASTSDAGLNKIFDEINKLEKKEYEAKVFSEYKNTYPYFVMFAIVLLVLDLLILERKTRLTRNLKLFEKKHFLS